MEMKEKTDAIYSIGTVQKITGLTGRQIRYYEEVGLVTPARSQGKQRLYSDNDIELLAKIKQLIGKGLNIEGVRSVLSGKGTKQNPKQKTVDLQEKPIEDKEELLIILNQMNVHRKFPLDQMPFLDDIDSDD